ncbi:sialin-like isoform X2 [Pomacea canaliculata]|uniref:sialin-like isoform X2 n=1 Tax=Pomacea canaliculata TaxID=400727 RepID=UPI000D72C7B1|nr:sialin-like isoform X2 [Pomacea canaliculata]
MMAATSTDVLEKAPALCSQRWNLAILSFFGFLILYVTRVNLSVAIICMVRAPKLNVTSDNHRILGKHGPSLNHTTTLPLVTAGNRTTEDDGISGSDCSLEILKSGLSLNDCEFDWDKRTQSSLLAMFFYGYIFTQIPGGWLAGRYGGQLVWGVSQAVCAVCTLAMPLAARANVYLAYALRFILGLGAGVTFPCIHAMMGRWAPKLERSKLVSFSFSGAATGNVLTFSLSALLCVYGFDNGWGSIFYLSGLGNLLWVVVWFMVTADTPAKHKRISEAERNYIETSIGESQVKKETLPTPWRAIFTSGPVWACIIAHMLNNYTGYTMLTSLPSFMKEVLKFDIKQNGALSAVPYICTSLVSATSGQVADKLRAKGILSTKNTRKLFQVMAFVGGAVCIVCVAYLNCTQRGLVVFLLCLCFSFLGLNTSAYCVNHIDLAPRHAGVLFGITNTAATIPGMIAPLVVGALTPNGTAEEWRRVFFVCAGLAVVGAILYSILADGELQSWALPPAMEYIVTDIKGGKEDGKEYLENHQLESFPRADTYVKEDTLDGAGVQSLIKPSKDAVQP